MRGFQLYRARDPRHAVELLAEHAGHARLLAGGTDLLVELKTAPRAPRVVIDISSAAELKRIALDEEGLTIGALATHGEIERSPVVRKNAPALVEAVHSIGAMQTRNLGTLGGNLVSAVPSMDSGPVLMALDATVVLSSSRGERRLTLAGFFLGPRRTALARDELLSAIVIPKPSLGKPAAFLKLGLRKGQALALVNVAVSAWVEHGLVRQPVIALGAVAPTVIRALRAEHSLEGKAPGTEAFAEAGRLAAQEAAPISDFRASEEYRRQMVAVLTRRALARCLSSR